jgi:hypothetical protein
MQPSTAKRLDTKRQYRIMRMIVAAAGEAPSGRRAHKIAVHPVDDAAIEGASLGLWAGQAAATLGKRGSLLEKHVPVPR